MVFRRGFIRTCLVVLGWLLVRGICAAGQRGLPASEGILNFGKVSEAVYRGAQPDAAAVANLKRLGIRNPGLVDPE